MNPIIPSTRKAESDHLRRLQDDKQVFPAVIDGSTIQCRSAFLDTMWRVMRFPDSDHQNVDAYVDWMTDLEWLGDHPIVLVIDHYSQFLVNDSNFRNWVIGNLKNHILPWWQEDVTRYSVAGKARPFTVYLLD